VARTLLLLLLLLVVVILSQQQQQEASHMHLQLQGSCQPLTGTFQQLLVLGQLQLLLLLLLLLLRLVLVLVLVMVQKEVSRMHLLLGVLDQG
jgi:hypothetical protein